MALDPAVIEKIINEIFSLNAPAIDPRRRDEIRNFIVLTINGDTAIQDYLVINAGLGPGRSGVLVYILTNARLIKIDIDEKNLQSSTPSLNTLTNVEWKVDGGRASVSILFPSGSFGLSYISSNQTITDFFKKVDTSRATRGAPSGQ